MPPDNTGCIIQHAIGEYKYMHVRNNIFTQCNKVSCRGRETIVFSRIYSIGYTAYSLEFEIMIRRMGCGPHRAGCRILTDGGGVSKNPGFFRSSLTDDTLAAASALWRHARIFWRLIGRRRLVWGRLVSSRTGRTIAGGRRPTTATPDNVHLTI